MKKNEKMDEKRQLKIKKGEECKENKEEQKMNKERSNKEQKMTRSKTHNDKMKMKLVRSEIM